EVAQARPDLLGLPARGASARRGDRVGDGGGVGDHALAGDVDDVRGWVAALAEAGGFAVDLHLAPCDQVFGGSAGGDPGLGQYLLQANALCVSLARPPRYPSRRPAGTAPAPAAGRPRPSPGSRMTAGVGRYDSA